MRFDRGFIDLSVEFDRKICDLSLQSGDMVHFFLENHIELFLPCNSFLAGELDRVGERFDFFEYF